MITFLSQGNVDPSVFDFTGTPIDKIRQNYIGLFLENQWSLSPKLNEITEYLGETKYEFNTEIQDGLVSYFRPKQNKPAIRTDPNLNYNILIDNGPIVGYYEEQEQKDLNTKE